MTAENTKKKFELKIVTLPPEVTEAMVREMGKGYDRRHPAPPPPPSKPGDVMPDGSIYAGVSPDTGEPMYATARDVFRLMNFNKAVDYAGTLAAHSHSDWRLPTKAELDVLYENRGRGALKRTFNRARYWSGTPYLDDMAYSRVFSNGNYSLCFQRSNAAVRCVRG